MRLPVALIALALAPAALAQDAPTVHVPDGLAKDAVVPVVIVEGGVLQRSGLPESLWEDRKAIVVETASIRDTLRDPDVGVKIEDAVERALDAAQAKRDISRCPWVLVGFSAAAPHFAQLAWRGSGRFQALALVNARVGRQHLIPAALGMRGHPTLILNGARDPVAPTAAANALAQLLSRTGLAVSQQVVDTDDHFVPLSSTGEVGIGNWLGTIPTGPVTTRAARPRRITTKGADGLVLTADLYGTGDTSKPIVCCFHQARSGRAEYRPIATRLVRAGFNCLALDQRSGGAWNGVRNVTAARAVAAGKVPTGRRNTLQSYLSARPDLERAIAWARELGYTGELAIIGSSYSSSLTIYVGADTAAVVAVVACSPGDYLPPRGSILEAGGRLQKPTLIICPPNEERQARPVFDAVAASAKELYVQPQGQHGARTFYTSPTADQAWAKLLGFLRKHMQ